MQNKPIPTNGSLIGQVLVEERFCPVFVNEHTFHQPLYWTRNKLDDHIPLYVDDGQRDNVQREDVQLWVYLINHMGLVPY